MLRFDWMELPSRRIVRNWSYLDARPSALCRAALRLGVVQMALSLFYSLTKFLRPATS